MPLGSHPRGFQERQRDAHHRWRFGGPRCGHGFRAGPADFVRPGNSPHARRSWRTARHAFLHGARAAARTPVDAGERYLFSRRGAVRNDGGMLAVQRVLALRDRRCDPELRAARTKPDEPGRPGRLRAPGVPDARQAARGETAIRACSTQRDRRAWPRRPLDGRENRRRHRPAVGVSDHESPVDRRSAVRQFER